MSTIALYNLESNIVNAAMMQVSSYHKKRGDIVVIYNPLFHVNYDRIYAFSLFQFTDKRMVYKDMIIGGTGFDISTRLPKVIEDEEYDWSLYPNCDYSIIWFSRGCIRRCPFCIVREKEGNIHIVKPKNLNPNGIYIKVMDNNFFANPNWRQAIDYLKKWNQPVDFQAIDVRLLTEEMCKTLITLRHYKQMKIAWDNPREKLENKLYEIIKIIKPYKLMCFVLIGFWSTPEEDLYRVTKLWELKIDPFVMPFDKNDEYQNKFARWVNMKAIFKTVKWEDYLKRNK